MNTNGLARHYDVLGPRERFALMVAAARRGDDVEHERLTRRAPCERCLVPEHHSLAQTMAFLALLHLLQSLDYAALLWKTEGLQGESDRLNTHLDQVDAIYAYLLLVESDAWQRFCAEMHLEPDDLIRGLPGYETMKKAEEEARVAACSAMAALQSVRARWGEGGLPTVETALADYRAALACREKLQVTAADRNFREHMR